MMDEEVVSGTISDSGGNEKLLQQVPEGHVIHTLVSEHFQILGILRTLDDLRRKLFHKSIAEESREILDEIGRCAGLLLDAENHHLRDGEVVCLELEKQGISGPPEIMRQEHKLLRPIKERLLNLAGEVAEKKPFSTLRAEIDETTDRMISNFLLHIQKEDNVLYPLALRTIDDPGIWEMMRERCDRIGYCSFTPGVDSR